MQLLKNSIQGMFTENVIYLENLSLASFAMLVEIARRTNNSIVQQKGGNGRFNK